MACPTIQTGNEFLAAALRHVDCQAQTIGAYGFGALASPGSPVSLALTSLLTIFVAIFGLRLLLNYPVGTRDIVADILKVGMVLTLATSWPAWRVVGYDLIINGPAEIAYSIGGAAQLAASGNDFVQRLNWTDQALSALGGWGSGRLGVAQGDWFQLGFARTAFLIGTLAPLALVRLLAGIALAIAPLMAGALLFEATRSLFMGWLKGLFMTYLASIVLIIVLSVEIAMLQPWLAYAIEKRVADQQILDAPVEVLVMTLSFTLIAFASIGFAAKIAFHYFAVISGRMASAPREIPLPLSRARVPGPDSIDDRFDARARRVSLAVSDHLAREERIRVGAVARMDGAAATSSAAMAGPASPTALGSSYRRGARRVSASGNRRDQKS